MVVSRLVGGRCSESTPHCNGQSRTPWGHGAGVWRSFPALMSALGMLLLLGCSPPPAPKKLEMEPIGTLKNVPTTPLVDESDSGVTTPNSGTPAPVSSACSASEFDN